MLKRALVISVFFATSAVAQQASPELGQQLFETHCAQCHGARGTGDGPMAEVLKVAPPDLTGLSARNEGVFPLGEVAMQIDGRRPMLSHGGEMPVFGPFLETDQQIAMKLANGQPMMTGLPLANVLTYLQSIQAE